MEKICQANINYQKYGVEKKEKWSRYMNNKKMDFGWKILIEIKRDFIVITD